MPALNSVPRKINDHEFEDRLTKFDSGSKKSDSNSSSRTSSISESNQSQVNRYSKEKDETLALIKTSLEQSQKLSEKATQSLTTSEKCLEKSHEILQAVDQNIKAIATQIAGNMIDKNNSVIYSEIDKRISLAKQEIFTWLNPPNNTTTNNSNTQSITLNDFSQYNNSSNNHYHNQLENKIYSNLSTLNPAALYNGAPPPISQQPNNFAQQQLN